MNVWGCGGGLYCYTRLFSALSDFCTEYSTQKVIGPPWVRPMYVAGRISPA